MAGSCTSCGKQALLVAMVVLLGINALIMTANLLAQNQFQGTQFPQWGRGTHKTYDHIDEKASATQLGESAQQDWPLRGNYRFR